MLPSAVVGEQGFAPLLLGVSLAAFPFVAKMWNEQSSPIRRAMLLGAWFSGFARIKFALLTAVVSALAVGRHATENQQQVLGIVAVIWALGTLCSIWQDPVPSWQALDEMKKICEFSNDRNVPVINRWDVGYWLLFSGCDDVFATPSSPAASYLDRAPAVFVFPETEGIRCRDPERLSSFWVRPFQYVAYFCPS